ncbi:MAG TPA: hypothetical protein VGR35_09340 [Tepidisphaeraceae bacterium]|nr:hypothetical protein [Tepidisphaeraceae bacterium]
MEQSTAKPALDLGRCLNDAMEVYRKNFLAFVLAVILFDVLMICSLLVLAGPLMGGMVLMCLSAMRDPEHKARLGDLFGTFHRFGAFVGFFFLTAIPILLGYALLIVPGVILSAMWMFAAFLMVDRHMGVIDALRTSWRVVIARGFWINVAAAFVITALFVGPVFVPYVGWVAGWLLAPLAWLINTSAYIQEVKEHSDLSEFAPRGFPVVPMAGIATPATPAT